MAKRHSISIVPLCDPQRFHDAQLNEAQTLRQLLQAAPALTLEPVKPEWMELTLEKFVFQKKEANDATPLYRPPGLTVENGHVAVVSTTGPATETATAPTETATAEQPLSSDVHPASITEHQAVRLAYSEEVKTAASFLSAGLSVLVVCEKLITRDLATEIVMHAKLKGSQTLEVPADGGGSGLMQSSLRARQLQKLKELLKTQPPGHALVVPHLDLLAGGEKSLPSEARELTELLYESSDRLLLAFADRSLEIPEVLAARFAVRLLISGVPREVTYPDGTRAALGQALVTASEAARFDGFDPDGLYKNVAGLNAIRLRHAITYAVQRCEEPTVPVVRLYESLRAFKAQTSLKFEVPDVAFEQIGGYEDVKAKLYRALHLLLGVGNLPPKLQRELIPRGFIFHGPPGTGKTLFAKAIANKLNATIQVVSGPEVTDMYVGESERKVRELFAEARRNAPSVLVFDEFDSIATQRSGRDDGGSRAGNALVAQILTEMDGFRPDVPILVIGTTNRLDIIDQALLRPSRFHPIAIGLPDPIARREIAKVHAKHFGIECDGHLLDLVVRSTDQFNGDEIRSLFRDACVGARVEDPPTPADARQFGRLIGEIRAARQQREANAAENRAGGRQGRDGNRTPTPAATPTPGAPSTLTRANIPQAPNTNPVSE